MVNIAHASITSTSKCCEEILLCVGPLSHSDILHDISAASEAVMTSQQPLEQRIARLWRDSRTNNNRDSTSPLVVFELLSYEQFMVKTIFFFNHGVLWNAKKKIPKKNIDFMQWTFDVPPLCNFATSYMYIVYSQKSCRHVGILH